MRATYFGMSPVTRQPSCTTEEKGQAFDRLYIDMTPVAAESGLIGRRCLILGQRGEGHRHGIFGIGANAVSAEGACVEIAHRKNRAT